MNEVFTVGHSTCSFEEILALLKGYGVQMLVDIRSRPHISFFPEFSKQKMKMKLIQQGIVYVFLGDSLGIGCRGAMKESDPAKVETTGKFIEAVQWVLDQAKYTKICLFCGERDPYQCHRHYLVGQNLMSAGLKVKHILLDGTVEEASPDLFHFPGGN